MRAEQPTIVKIAVAARHLNDCLRLRGLAGADGTQVLIAMGAAGLLTRVWPAWCGSYWTYAGTAAPGQLPASVLSNSYRVRETTADTDVYAIVGRPLAHSASPAMHNAAMAEAGIDGVYVPLETSDAGEFLSFAEAIGVRGASVTVPLKTDLAAAVPADGAATEIGAINTLRRTPDGWEAENFDIHGFLSPFERRSWDLQGLRTLVLGAGGAARAVVAGLVDRGALVTVCARRLEAAASLATAFCVGVTPWPPAVEWDLLVNATTVGMWPHSADAPIDRALLQGPRVYDLIYNPPETTLLTWARESGAETIGGLEMLVGQACRQFEWWMGRTAPKGVMARAAREFINDLRNEDRV
jgi:3-dehydroquinate dehydratase/shikimate dehydrogenase